MKLVTPFSRTLPPPSGLPLMEVTGNSADSGIYVYTPTGWNLLEATRQNTPLGQFIASLVKAAIDGAVAGLGTQQAGDQSVIRLFSAVSQIAVGRLSTEATQAVTSMAEQLADALYSRLAPLLPKSSSGMPAVTPDARATRLAGKFPL